MKKILGLALGITMIALTPELGNASSAFDKFEKRVSRDRMKCLSDTGKLHIHETDGTTVFFQGFRIKVGEKIKNFFTVTSLKKKKGKPIFLYTYKFEDVFSHENYVDFVKRAVIHDDYTLTCY